MLPRRAGRLLGLVTAVALVAAACAAADDPAARESAPAKDSSTAPAAADASLQAFSALLDDEGTLSLRAALSVYAALLGPLPGVTPADLGTDPAEDLLAPAIRVLGRNLAAVPPSARAQVRATLDQLTAAAGDAEIDVQIPADGGAGESAAGAHEGRAGVRSDAPTASALRADLLEIRDDLSERAGHPMRLTVRARVVGDSVTGGDAVTAGAPVGGPYTTCVITVPTGRFDEDGASVRSTLAHEMWHCFQLDSSPVAFESGPEWIVEGQAEWAGEEYVDGSPSSAGRWDTWLTTVPSSLYRRSYDAIGLYAVASQHGSDPWRTMLPMLRQRGERAVTTLFGSDAVTAQRAISEALVRAPELGDNWESTGPGITGADGTPPFDVSPENPLTAAAAAGPFGSLDAKLDVAAGDVLVLSAPHGTTATVELPGLDATPVPIGGSLAVCVDPEGCTCPDGTDPGLPTAGPGRGAVAIGTTVAQRLTVSAQYRSLEDECDASLVGQWSIPVRTVLRTLLTAYGGARGPDCDGPMLLTFGEDGTFGLDYRARCTFGSVAGVGRATLRGRYTTAGTTVAVSGVTGAGSVTVRGVRMPLPFVDGLRRTVTAPGEYRVDGDQLTIDFTTPEGRRVSFTYSRVP